MNEVVVLNGIKLQLNQPDLDGDGKTGGVEMITPQQRGEMSIIQPTELGDSLKQLNEDSIDSKTRMSGIDMRANLHYLEINSILAIDALVALGVLPTKCLAFTRQKKRLSASQNGVGRNQIVEIVAGKREQDAKAGMGGFGDKVKGFLGMGQGGQQ